MLGPTVDARWVGMYLIQKELSYHCGVSAYSNPDHRERTDIHF